MSPADIIAREPALLDLDPIWNLMPADQIDRVFAHDTCDISSEFLGFTGVYLALASIIPKHFTVVDLGCAYAPQAHIFQGHKAYIGVDVSDCPRFSALNTTHYQMTIDDFIQQHAGDLDHDRSFAICSYVPPWYRADNQLLVRNAFKNVFAFYPATDPDRPLFPAIRKLAGGGT